jgi:hypothetical protein
MRIPSDIPWRDWSLRPAPVERFDFETELCERIDLERALESLPGHLEPHGQMLRARLAGEAPTEIARRFGVSRGCVLYRLRLVLRHLGVKDPIDL